MSDPAQQSGGNEDKKAGAPGELHGIKRWLINSFFGIDRLNNLSKRFNRFIGKGRPLRRYYARSGPGMEPESFYDLAGHYQVLKHELNTGVRNIEDSWGSDNPHPLGLGHLDPDLKKQVWDAFSVVGPFTDKHVVDEIKDAFLHGTSDHQGNSFDHIWENNMDYFSIQISGEWFSVKIPREKHLRMPDGSMLYLRTFGIGVDAATIKRKYREVALKIIQHIEKKLKNEISSNNTAEAQIRLNYLQENIMNIFPDNIMTDLTEGIEKLNTPGLRDLEVNLEAYFENKEIQVNTITQLANTIRPRAMHQINKGVVRWPRTYMIVNSNASEAELTASGLTTINNFGPRGDETDLTLGLDHNGWSLEVIKFDDLQIVDKKYVLKHLHHTHDDARPEGTQWVVYIDVIERRDKVRCFWEETENTLVVEIPANQMLPYIINDYDLFRDSLRDGRYFKDSLATFDYILADANPEFTIVKRFDMVKGSIQLDKKMLEIAKKKDEMAEKKDKKDSKDEKDPREFEVTLRDQDKFGGWSYTGKRTPTNLSPAFDMRFLHTYNAKKLKSTAFGSKKYYYDTPAEVYEYSAEISANPKHPDYAYWGPRITSRGLAMYMTNYVMQHEIFMKDIRRSLEKLGAHEGHDETEGFDIGPRTFGQDFYASLFAIIKKISPEAKKEIKREDLGK